MATQKSLLPAITVGVLYYLLGIIGFKLLLVNTIVSVGMFVPEGVALAFAIYFGKRVVIGIFFGQFLLAYTNTTLLLPSIGIASVNSMEALIGIYLFKRFKLSRGLESFRDILILFAIIFFVLQPFSALLSDAVLLVTNEIKQSEFLYLTFSWWFGNIMGQLLVTPFLLLFFTNYKNINLKEYFLYGAVFFLFLYLLEIVLEIKNPFILMSFSISFIIFVIIRKNIIYATFLNTIAAIVSAYSVYSGIGTFSFESVHDDVINYNLYVLSHIAISWLVGILFEERKHYERSLEEEISQVMKENKEQQLFLLQQNRLAQMGELISMIAHQWRQPLNNLSLINQFIISKFQKNKLDETTVEYFKENSKKQIELMSDTIDDFRNFFKANEEKQSFLLEEVIQNAIKILEPMLSKNMIKIKFETKESHMVFGYANSFIQVILNIFKNAQDAFIEKDVDSKKIFVKMKTLNDSVLLCIEDNAGGINNDIIDKVFDPYFSTKKDKNGTGLGLYMSKMIVEEHMHGQLNVLNGEKGAKFIITMKTIGSNL